MIRGAFQTAGSIQFMATPTIPVSLLNEEEITQEIVWNMRYLHHYMAVPPRV